MSDRARTDEIDGIMSSVRRLVSDAEAGSGSGMRQMSRFLLTPALRVSEPCDVDTSIIQRQATSRPNNLLVLDPNNRAERAGLEATIAELEAAVTAQTDNWEADGGEAFEHTAWAASAFQLRDAVVDAATASVFEPATAADTTDSADVVQMPDQAEQTAVSHPLKHNDHDLLRALVVQIVREELSGEMGERITRNVRKLVRREINRVLVSRELD
ncbi:hypothetical protein [Yoonia sp.]|uniref:hypothetical protein n=1 Tax=Yoonia sp. TaxID=2212373 RepID=UPI0025F4E897|nr:hypothetical protein [Yoonia sp.]